MNPKTPEQLAHSIEELVSTFVAETRRAVAETVDRSLSVTSTKRSPSRGRGPRRTGKRRSAEDLSKLCDTLYTLVCAQPGESMTVFSDEIGLSVRDLHRPMSKLKDDGRIRSVGERYMARYFPAVSARSREA